MPESLNRPAEDRIVRLQRPTGNGRDRQPDVSQLTEQLKSLVEDATKNKGAPLSRPQLYMKIGELVNAEAERHGWELSMPDRRQLIAELVGTVQMPERPIGAPAVRDQLSAALGTHNPGSKPGEMLSSASRESIEEAKSKIQPIILDRMDMAAAAQLSREDLSHQLAELVAEILAELKLRLNLKEQQGLVELLLNDMLGLGPLEPLLADETVTDIMVNGANKVYVERKGKLVLTDVRFRNDAHVMNIANRIVSQVGRRIDESQPLCDARLLDGSRVNIIVPPLAIDGPSISIRKFSKKNITLDIMARQGNISPHMATVLKIAARSRLNILISGGTGSGKTTLLNAMSQMIDPGDRIVTIEDAAELQLQQPHVVRLETRPPSLEGSGEITMRDLVKNSLRMRPDRIIMGEVRGSEAVDMLQAMNTGHEGSLSTIHANKPREALTRLENMVGMAGINLPSKAVRTQIAAALDIIVQVSRMRDGMRRVTHVMEVVGMEGDVITTQDLFVYEFEGEDADGKLRGNFRCSGLRPHFTPKAAYFGLDRPLLEAMV
ncbi:MAG: pilus assembly protein CpaF cpaF [Rhodospirillales bacterium]|nr:pilus assembly protein CpaF cpaF [Rhodospirillales bacterium]